MEVIEADATKTKLHWVHIVSRIAVHKWVTPWLPRTMPVVVPPHYHWELWTLLWWRSTARRWVLRLFDCWALTSLLHQVYVCLQLLFSCFNMLLSWATNCHQHVHRLLSGLHLSRCYPFSLKLTCTVYCFARDWLLYHSNPCCWWESQLKTTIHWKIWNYRPLLKNIKYRPLFFECGKSLSVLWHIMSASSPMHPAGGACVVVDRSSLSMPLLVLCIDLWSVRVLRYITFYVQATAGAKSRLLALFFVLAPIILVQIVGLYWDKQLTLCWLLSKIGNVQLPLTSPRLPQYSSTAALQL